MLIDQHATAINAFHAHEDSGKSSIQRGNILSFIEQNSGAVSSWSIGELAKALNMEKSTVSARINELLYDTGELEIKPKRKDRISGITIRPVGLPAKQLGLFQ